VDTLKGMGFVLNPYDRCVVNKNIKGKQYTICWYVDDNKVSHEVEEVVTSIIKEISRHFGESTATREETKLYLKDKQTLIRNKRVVYNIIYDRKYP